MTRLTWSTLRGLGVQCVIPDCKADTAEQSPRRYRATPEAVLQNAKDLGWIAARLAPGEDAVWFCPLHQRYEESSRRWVPAYADRLPEQERRGA